MRDASQLSVVFVGCGGTFFMGMPLFKVLVHRYKPKTLFIDPDTVLGKNQDRQWPHAGRRGRAKSCIAAEEFGVHNLSAGVCSFAEFIEEPENPLAISRHGDRPNTVKLGDVLVVVNVDNDKARLEVREWCRNRKGWSGMVLSGCEVNFGQAYWGVWEDMNALHDWAVMHKDVGQVEEDIGHPCAPQTAEANALTGVMAGLALGDLLELYRTREIPDRVREYYWSRDELLCVNSRTLEIVRQGVRT